MNEEEWEEIDLPDALLEPGDKQANPAPLVKYDTVQMPDRLTPTWVKGQLPAALWKANKSAINPESIVFMANKRAAGLSAKAVMARLGLGSATWHQWMKKARAGEQPYLLWSQCVAYAESDIEEELIEHIRVKAQDDFKAATWLLSKINNEDYNEKASTTVNIHGDVNNNQQQNTVNSLSNDEIANILGVFKELRIEDRNLSVVDGEVVEDDA